MENSTLVIGDIHHKTGLVDKIAHHHRDDVQAVVLLGDYQDDFGDNPATAAKTAQWMKDKLEQGWILLMGNHDMSYMFSLKTDQLFCPGWTKDKQEAIDEILTKRDWLKMKFWYHVGSFLVSHAGFDYHWAHPFKGLSPEYLNDIHNVTMYQLSHGFCAPDIVHWKHSRLIEEHIQHPYDSPLWMDWVAFQPIAGVNQIVGHTPASHIRRKVTPDSVNYCIDTHLHDYTIVTQKDGLSYVQLLSVENINIEPKERKPIHVIDQSGKTNNYGRAFN
jgi:hypothetical protein